MLLQVIWFVLIGVLFAGYAVLDGFDLGVGTLYPFLGKTEADKAVLRTSTSSRAALKERKAILTPAAASMTLARHSSVFAAAPARAMAARARRRRPPLSSRSASPRRRTR